MVRARPAPDVGNTRPLPRRDALDHRRPNVRDIISVAGAPERHNPRPQVSELAAASRNGQPRAIRDRLDPGDYQQLLTAVRAGVCKKALAAEYGISRRSIYRLLAG
jgi:hypothetical protein